MIITVKNAATHKKIMVSRLFNRNPSLAVYFYIVALYSKLGALTNYGGIFHGNISWDYFLPFV